MKRKFKNKLLIILTVLASLFIFGGCTLGETFEEILSTRDLNPYVTYYANGGIFEDKKSEKNIYYKIGSGVLNIAETSNTTSGTVKVNRDGYTLLGWYFVELDEEGKPIFEDEEKGLYKLGEPFDFKKTLVQLHENGKGVNELSREYGVGKSTIDSWIKKFKTITTSTGETTNNDEILKLKKELQQVQIENEILKKAVAIFSKK